MSFYEHFDELRSRLMRCLLVFFIGFIACYFIAEPILGILRKPLFDVMPIDQQKLYFTSLFENFLTHLKIAGYASLFLFSPYYFYQIWAFVAPGLYPRERKLVLPFVFSATLFFVGGACFAYFVLFPVGFKYFVTYGGPSDVPLLTIDSYYGTCLKLLLLFGLAFELPVIICLLGYLGVVDAAFLRQQRKNAILAITFLSALFAPPDAVSMLILGIPLILLYEAAIWVVQAMGVRRNPEASQSPGKEENPFIGKSRP
jgi:sec-independent protein translocase protein TatC